MDNQHECIPSETAKFDAATIHDIVRRHVDQMPMEERTDWVKFLVDTVRGASECSNEEMEEVSMYLSLDTGEYGTLWNDGACPGNIEIMTVYRVGSDEYWDNWNILGIQFWDKGVSKEFTESVKTIFVNYARSHSLRVVG